VQCPRRHRGRLKGASCRAGTFPDPKRFTPCREVQRVACAQPGYTRFAPSDRVPSLSGPLRIALPLAIGAFALVIRGRAPYEHILQPIADISTLACDRFLSRCGEELWRDRPPGVIARANSGSSTTLHLAACRIFERERAPHQCSSTARSWTLCPTSLDDPTADSRMVGLVEADVVTRTSPPPARACGSSPECSCQVAGPMRSSPCSS